VLNYTNLDNRLKTLEGEGLSQAVADYLEEHPVEAGATTEEAAQIAQNKQDIENLSAEKLDAGKLPEAINDALAQAKVSGEFKGEPGEPGKDGQDGSPGKDGADGKDYILTEADKQEIAELASELVDVPDSGGNANQGSGLTSAVKNALLNCFAHVAWTDENGQSYYDALATALNSSGGDSGDDDSGDDGGTTVVTLTRISAVYGGGDVASGTALSELTDIVVTAHYSDGSTKNITNFELSGVIAEGSNTITVSYGGMVTTFEVVGTSTVRVYLDMDCTLYNVDKATVYSDDGESTAPIPAAANYGFLANRTFENDVDVHFRLVWGDTTVWRNLVLLSVVPVAMETGKQNMNLNGGTVYRSSPLEKYYVEGDGNTYTYAGNVYEGIYRLKAGCAFGIGKLSTAATVQYNTEESYFYVEG
jgi:hypothetical protein